MAEQLMEELTAGWREEDVFLVDVCAGRAPSAEAGGLDWGYVLEAAEHHRVIPLLRHATELSEEIRANVDARTHGAVQRNLILTGELARLSRRFDAEGIDMVAMKGAELAVRAYGSVGRRTFGDIDLLVRRRDIARAGRMLVSDGYASLRGPDIEELAKTQLGIEFVHSDGLRVVELHWNLLNRVMKYEPDIDGIWMRRVAVDISGQPVAAMSLEDEFLYLCAHGTKHCWEHLQHLADLAGIVQRHEDSINWDWIGARAAEQSSARMVNVAAILLKGLLGVDVPAPVAKMADEDRVALKLAKRISGWIAFGNSARTATDTARFHLLVRERLVDRLPYSLHVARLAFTPSDRDRAFVRLPSSLSVLYFFVRPIRIINDRIRSSK